MPGTARRFQDFLDVLSRHDLPVFFHSLGGNNGEALLIGLLLRELRMTAGAGHTITEPCRSVAAADPCRRLIVSDGRTARLRAGEGRCLSACVLALAGASSRRIAPGAILGVHASRFDPKLRQLQMQRSPGAAVITLSTIHSSLEQYLVSMGIDPQLQQLANRVDARRMYVLSRDQVRRFGIEAVEFNETPWVSLTDRAKHGFALKLAARVTDTGREEHRTVLLRCLLGQIWLAYERASPTDEIVHTASAGVAASELHFRRGAGNQTEIWAAAAAPSFLRAAAMAKGLVITEQLASDRSDGGSLRAIKLSTVGLSHAFESVVTGCDGKRSPEGAGSDAKKQ